MRNNRLAYYRNSWSMVFRNLKCYFIVSDFCRLASAHILLVANILMWYSHNDKEKGLEVQPISSLFSKQVITHSSETPFYMYVFQTYHAPSSFCSGYSGDVAFLCDKNLHICCRLIRELINYYSVPERLTKTNYLSNYIENLDVGGKVWCCS